MGDIYGLYGNKELCLRKADEYLSEPDVVQIPLLTTGATSGMRATHYDEGILRTLNARDYLVSLGWSGGNLTAYSKEDIRSVYLSKSMRGVLFLEKEDIWPVLDFIISLNRIIQPSKIAGEIDCFHLVFVDPSKDEVDFAADR